MSKKVMVSVIVRNPLDGTKVRPLSPEVLRTLKALASSSESVLYDEDGSLRIVAMIDTDQCSPYLASKEIFDLYTLSKEGLITSIITIDSCGFAPPSSVIVLGPGKEFKFEVSNFAAKFPSPAIRTYYGESKEEILERTANLIEKRDEFLEEFMRPSAFYRDDVFLLVKELIMSEDPAIL